MYTHHKRGTITLGCTSSLPHMIGASDSARRGQEWGVACGAGGGLVRHLLASHKDAQEGRGRENEHSATQGVDCGHLLQRQALNIRAAKALAPAQTKAQRKLRTSWKTKKPYAMVSTMDRYDIASAGAALTWRSELVMQYWLPALVSPAHAPHFMTHQMPPSTSGRIVSHA